eukprot:7401364-Heterocapsa_arctica.AAC.1
MLSRAGAATPFRTPTTARRGRETTCPTTSRMLDLGSSARLGQTPPLSPTMRAPSGLPHRRNQATTTILYNLK